MTAKCNYCFREVPRIRTAKKNPNKSYVYVDSAGGRWNSKRCPKCESQRVSTYRKERYQRVKPAKRSKAKKRGCRECGVELAPQFYFLCADHQPQYTDYLEAYVYG